MRKLRSQAQPAHEQYVEQREGWLVVTSGDPAAPAIQRLRIDRVESVTRAANALTWVVSTGTAHVRIQESYAALKALREAQLLSHQEWNYRVEALNTRQRAEDDAEHEALAAAKVKPVRERKKAWPDKEGL